MSGWAKIRHILFAKLGVDFEPVEQTAAHELKVSDASTKTALGGRFEHVPGPFGQVVTASGDTVVYTAAAGVAFRLWWAYAVPVVRGEEEPPLVTIKILDSANALIDTPYVVAALSREKVITCPAGAKIAVNLDIAGRVACSFDVEEFTP